MIQISLTTTRYERKQGTKTAYKVTEQTTELVDERVYNNVVTSASFFRRLGGSVTQQKGYTCAGYRVVKDISTSPDRENKTIREFDFKYLD
jgi:hypothetical protein